MKTKTEIELELLQEIDEICSLNNLKYILFDIDGLNPFNKSKKSPGMVSVAMTQGDIDRFIKIIEDECHESRYLEGMFNNPKYLPMHIEYGNRNTTAIPILELGYNLNYGIHIAIHPIVKSANINGKRIDVLGSRLSKEKKIRKILNKRVENPKFWHLKAGLKLSNIAYSITGGGKRYYNEIKKRISVDRWEDIQDYSELRINGTKVKREDLKDIERIELEGIRLSASKGSEEFFLEKMKGKIAKESEDPNHLHGFTLIETEIGYEEVLNDTKDILLEAKIAKEELCWRKSKEKSDSKTFKNLWNLVEMTGKQVNFINHFEEIDSDLSEYDLNDEMQFNELCKELEPVIKELKEYSKYGMSFSIDDKTDRLIEDVLLKKGEEKLVKKIRGLKEKEHFIE